MIPAGYMAKRIMRAPSDWFKTERVVDIYSVSGDMSDDFADYIEFWKHNGYWFFDSPQAIVDLARDKSIDLDGTKLFFYEVYEFEFDEGQWNEFRREPSFKTDVLVPVQKSLEGFDVVTFTARTSAEHSPLSCNGLASEIETNAHCLLASAERAKELLEAGAFKDGEPGPHRIFAVYSVPEWS